MNKKHPYDFVKHNHVHEEASEVDAEQSLETPTAETAEPQIDLTDEALVQLIKTQLCPECTTGKEAEDTRLRALAEVDNTRKRLEKELQESRRYAASSVLGDILPSLDNLDLALKHAEGQEACKNFFIGVDMTKKLLLESLKKHGLEPVGNVGETFDPNIHEAVGMEEDPEIENGAVCSVMAKGYKLHERLLRPAKVIVCKK